jgi:hypothetical protein
VMLAMAQDANDVSNISPQCFDAIAGQETGKNNCPCKIDTDGTGFNSCGLYQIKVNYWADCTPTGTQPPSKDPAPLSFAAMQTYFPTCDPKVCTNPITMPYPACAYNKQCSENCVKNYVKRYFPADPMCQAMFNQYKQELGDEKAKWWPGGHAPQPRR